MARRKNEGHRAPGAGVPATDVHFQQNVVIGTEDRLRFEAQMQGFVKPLDFGPQISAMKGEGIALYGSLKAGMGDVVDESRLFYSIEEEVRRNFRLRHATTPPPGNVQSGAD